MYANRPIGLIAKVVHVTQRFYNFDVVSRFFASFTQCNIYKRLAGFRMTFGKRPLASSLRRDQ